MPNTLAYIVIFFWPIVVFYLFWKMPISKALIYSILGGYLFLPTGVVVDLPVIPPLDKTFVPSVSATIMCIFIMWQKNKIKDASIDQYLDDKMSSDSEATTPKRRKNKIASLLILILFLSAALTISQNREPLFIADFVIPGLRPYDALSTLSKALVALLPFFLARRFLSTPDSHRYLLLALCYGALAYSILILIEVRLSPQLNKWLYGFFPHSFLQHIRWGGFRPIVFLQHGLWVGMFIAMAVLGSVSIWRSPGSPWSKPIGLCITIWLGVTLVLSKTLGALAIAIFFLPVMALTKVRTQALVAALIATSVILYPALRGAGWIPVNYVADITRSINEERAASFEYRLDNEDILLEKAEEKPLFGWGGWGRARIYDPETGRDLSTTDGAWIIIIGNFGWLGYIARFGLITLPLTLLLSKRYRQGLSPATSGLGIVLAANLIDLIPNATLTPITYLLAGAIMGAHEQDDQEEQTPNKRKHVEQKSKTYFKRAPRI